MKADRQRFSIRRLHPVLVEDRLSEDNRQHGTVHGIAIHAIRPAHHRGLSWKDRCGRALGAHQKYPITPVAKSTPPTTRKSIVPEAPTRSSATIACGIPIPT